MDRSWRIEWNKCARDNPHLKRKRRQRNEWSNILQESSQARQKPAQPVSISTASTTSINFSTVQIVYRAFSKKLSPTRPSVMPVCRSSFRVTDVSNAKTSRVLRGWSRSISSNASDTECHYCKETIRKKSTMRLEWIRFVRTAQ